MLSLTDIAARIGSGALTPADALRQSREAITAHEPSIRAFVCRDEATGPTQRGPLRGVAVGVKDIIDTADLPTEYGTPIYAGWRPKADATVVSMLKRAGATIVGKTTTTAMAFLDPTETRNPHHPGHTPGGSSAGSAAAVAAGMIPLAIGSQTGGSVIRPASYCGVAAIKPSFRCIPTVGAKVGSWTLDTLGLFAARVEDLGLGLAAITGRSDLDEAPERRPRLAVLEEAYAGERSQDSIAALERAAGAAARAGAEILRPADPDFLAAAWAAQTAIQNYEMVQSLAWEYDTRRDALPPIMRKHLDAVQAIPVEAYDEARRVAHRARGLLGRMFADFDAVLTLSAPGAAPEGFASTGEARFNRLWTLMGNPCVNVPALCDAKGLPVGVQVIAPFGRDGMALAAARFVETALRER